MSEYQLQLQQARALLRSGDAQQAFQTFRPLLRYPGLVKQPAEFSEALQVLADISAQIAGAEFASLLRTAARTPTDVRVLYRTGYELIEYDLGDMAATILARAHQLEPDNREVLHELSAALEREMNYPEARRFLQQASGLAQDHFLTCYLLAFNSLMSGDIETPRRLFPDLQRLQAQDASFAQMAERIAVLLERAEALRGSTPLDTHDLRGWHLALTGGLLLHLSPHGFDQPMYGRYAWVQDSYGLCLLGILRVQAVLKTLQLEVPCIWLLPDRNSQILAHATAHVLEVPLKPWPEDGSQEPGLVVAYDLNHLDGKTLVSVRYHHPGQILWGHASCWTKDQPVSADLTTFLYQSNTEPWGKQLIVDPEHPQTTLSQADEHDPAVIAAELVASTPEAGLPEDEPGLLALTHAAATVEKNILALLEAKGQRPQQWAGSPVPSSFFL